LAADERDECDEQDGERWALSHAFSFRFADRAIVFPTPRALPVRAAELRNL
jgi:hypothetical protein